MTGVEVLPLGPERIVAIDGRPDPTALAGFVCLRLGEAEYMLLGATVTDLPLDGDVLAVDVGDAWEGWSVAGPGAADFLARICALDLAGFAPGAAVRTAMGGIAVVLRRIGETSWELRVERSYAGWFEAWLRAP
jgi:heterotetrameric sarcosine oxidase gamma subunit